MITLDCEQGGQEWLAAHVGIPTASAFDKILTPRTRKPSSSADKYLREKLAEWLTGRTLDESIGQFMQRGNVMEAEAVAFYELTRSVQTEKVGFCLRDDRLVGCSPDRLVGEDGLLEIKCPALTTHIGYLLTDSGLDDYACQTQGQLWITGRAWVDVVAYNPELPPAVVRYARDEAFIAALAANVNAFVSRLAEGRQHLLALGCVPREPLSAEDMTPKISTVGAGIY